MERSGQQVVEGAVADGHHSAGQADDVIGHAEVWCRQVDQQRLCVQAHKIAGAVRGRKSGEQKKKKERQPAQDRCFMLTRMMAAGQSRFPVLGHSQRGEERALLHIHVLHCNDAGHQGTEHR